MVIEYIVFVMYFVKDWGYGGEYERIYFYFYKGFILVVCFGFCNFLIFV